jgi:hypothetical protein
MKRVYRGPLQDKSIVGWVIVATLMLGFLLTLKATDRTPLIPYAQYLVFFAQVLVMGCGLVLFVAKYKFHLCSGWSIYVWITLFLLWTLAIGSGLWSHAPELSIQRAIITFLPSLLLLIMVFVDDRPLSTFSSVAFCVVTVLSFLAFLSIVLYFFGNTSWRSEFRIQELCIGPLCVSQRVYGIQPFLRASSLFGNPNSFAGMLFFAVPLVLFLRSSGRISRFSFIAISSILACGLLLTMSRAGIGAAVVAASVYIFLSTRTILKRSVLLALFMVFSLALMLVFADSQVRGLDTRLSSDLNERGDAWVPLVESFFQSPLLGRGFGVSTEAILEQSAIDFGGHNAHLQLLSELGLAGYTIFILCFTIPMFVLIFKVDFRGDHSERVQAFTACLAILSAVLLHQVVEGSLLRFSFLTQFWFFIVGSMVRLGHLGTTANLPAAIRVDGAA